MTGIGLAGISIVVAAVGACIRIALSNSLGAELYGALASLWAIAALVGAQLFSSARLSPMAQSDKPELILDGFSIFFAAIALLLWLATAPTSVFKTILPFAVLALGIYEYESFRAASKRNWLRLIRAEGINLLCPFVLLCLLTWFAFRPWFPLVAYACILPVAIRFFSEISTKIRLWQVTNGLREKKMAWAMANGTGHLHMILIMNFGEPQLAGEFAITFYIVMLLGSINSLVIDRWRYAAGGRVEIVKILISLSIVVVVETILLAAAESLGIFHKYVNDYKSLNYFVVALFLLARGMWHLMYVEAIHRKLVASRMLMGEAIKLVLTIVVTACILFGMPSADNFALSLAFGFAIGGILYMRDIHRYG